MSLEKKKILPSLCSWDLVGHFAKMILCEVVLCGLEGSFIIMFPSLTFPAYKTKLSKCVKVRMEEGQSLPLSM